MNYIKNFFTDKLNILLAAIAIFLISLTIFSYEFNIYLDSTWFFSEATLVAMKMEGLSLKELIFFTVQNFISNTYFSSYSFIFAFVFKFISSNLELIWKSFSIFSIITSLYFFKKFINRKEKKILYILYLTASPFFLYLTINGRHLFELPIIFALIYFIDTSFNKERSQLKLYLVSILIFVLMTLNFFLSIQILIPLLFYFKNKIKTTEEMKKLKKFSIIFLGIALYSYHLIYFYTTYSRIYTVAGIVFVLSQLVLFSLIRINRYFNHFFFYPLFAYTGLIVLGGSEKVEAFINQFHLKDLGGVLSSLSDYSIYFLIFLLPGLALILKEIKKISFKDFRVKAILISIICVLLGTMRFKHDLLLSFLLFVFMLIPLTKDSWLKPLTYLLGAITLINLVYFPFARDCKIPNYAYEIAPKYCPKSYELFDYNAFIDKVAPKLNLDNEKPYQIYTSTHAYNTDFTVTDIYADFIGQTRLFEVFYRLKYKSTVLTHYFTPKGEKIGILPGSFLVIPMLGIVKDEFKLYQLALKIFNEKFSNEGFSFDMTEIKFDTPPTNQFHKLIYYYVYRLKLKDKE